MNSPPSRHYSFEAVVDGAYAAVARRDGWGICNSGLVDLGGESLVFDTSLTPTAARDLRTAVAGIFGRGPSLAANSHWHLDHSLGNQEFPSVPIWGTRRTREILLEMTDALMAELSREKVEKDIGELEQRRDGLGSQEAREDLEFLIQINRAIAAEAGNLRIAAPNQTFETRVTLPGERGAELVSFGSGHTEADSILFLPHEKVIFAGDLVVVGLQPSMGSGDPDHWLVVLDEIDRLGAERIVPGHGPVVGAEGTHEIRGYVSGVLEAADAPIGATLPAAIRRWEGTLSLDENLTFARARVALGKSQK